MARVRTAMERLDARFYDTVSAESLLVTSPIHAFAQQTTLGNRNLCNFQMLGQLPGDAVLGIKRLIVTAPEEFLPTWVYARLAIVIGGKPVTEFPVWYPVEAEFSHQILGEQLPERESKTSDQLWPFLAWKLEPKTHFVSYRQTLSVDVILDHNGVDVIPTGSLRVCLEGFVTRDIS